MTVTENYLSIIKESSLFVFGKILKEKKIELLEEDRSEDLTFLRLYHFRILI